MFDIGWSEMLIMGAVALVVIGPKELPGALKTFAYWMKQANEQYTRAEKAERERDEAQRRLRISEDHRHTIMAGFDEDEKRHPWYGPCDAFVNGSCSECSRSAR